MFGRFQLRHSGDFHAEPSRKVTHGGSFTGSRKRDWTEVSLTSKAFFSVGGLRFMSGLTPWWHGVSTDWRHYAILGAAGIVIWVLWAWRWVLSHLDRPVENDFRTTTSVVVPSYREDPRVLMRCLETWRAEKPTEIIVVIDNGDDEAYRLLVNLNDPVVQPVRFAHQGKRSALGVGIRLAIGEVIVLADSDTAWEPGLLAAVQMPFFDPKVGGVGTRQSVYQRKSKIWRRVASWMIDLRYSDYVPAMGRAGGVVCLSGRTAAYRRTAVLPVLTHLEDEFFLGRRCIAGDDGRLTWLVLASGYKTVHQSSAHAVSMFPSTFRAFVKQRIRWSRNSYRCYFTAAYKGWLWRQPLVSQATVLQILATPITMGYALGSLVFGRLQITGVGITLALAWLLLGRGLRSVSHLRRHPSDIWLLPLIVLVTITISLPIKTFAFFTMNRQGWLTRDAEHVGGEGQTESTVMTVKPEAVHA
jgi:N-acetylglucosaminyltransferase